MTFNVTLLPPGVSDPALRDEWDFSPSSTSGGLLTVLTLLLKGVFSQNEKQLNICNDMLKELQKK